MAQTWGLTKPIVADQLAGVKQDAPRRAAPAKLSPRSARAAHHGIVWLHVSAIAVWLFVALTLGFILAAGKPVPPVAVLAGAAAAAGHGLFLAVHLYMASLASRRLVAESAA